MRAIAEWCDKAGIARGALFRRVETWFDGSIRGVGEEALNPGTITLIYKRLIRQAFDKKLLGAMSEAELERWVAAVSSHSIRVGVAQDNFAAGESLPAIMQAYRWRDPKTGGTSRFVIWTAAVGTNGQQKPERCRKVY